MTQKQNPYKFY